MINYERINFKDYPDTSTPLTANNLNKMDKGIYDLDKAMDDTNELLGSASDASGVNGDTAFEKIGQLGDNLTASDNLIFQFAKSGNSYGYKDANNNFVPFKNGAVLVGTYSSNTTVNVSAYSPTSANQFVLVPSSDAANSNEFYYQNGRSIYTIHASFYFSLGTLSLNGDNLIVTLPKVNAAAKGIYSNGTIVMTTTTEKYIPCKLYYIG